MSCDDDGEDNKIEAGGEQPEGCRESVQTQLVESGVERSGDEREDSLEEGEDGECSAHLLAAQQFRQVRPEQSTSENFGLNKNLKGIRRSLINLSKISSFVSDFCQRKLRDPFLLPAGGGYCVPQHEESIGEVENPELSVEGCEEEANNDEGDSYDEDNGVPPLQKAAHEWHYNNLQ